jgi:serine palmitoyltransferase
VDYCNYYYYYYDYYSLTGRTLPCLNLASYNYLGFATTLPQQGCQGPDEARCPCPRRISVEAEGSPQNNECTNQDHDHDDNNVVDPQDLELDAQHCLREAVHAVVKYGVSTTGSRNDAGSLAVHDIAEQQIAKFVGKEAAMIMSMGYATNSTCIPALVSAGDLIVSDSLNHASIVAGCRASGAKIKVFRHNDCDHLERILRHAILKGRSRTRRPYGKILIIVEGVYSMEGEICRLREIVALKRRYKCYLYIDEAHSIGALGATGRGVCEHAGVDPADVDVLMGTFTKAFASAGGYIAADRAVIDHLRRTSSCYVYDTAMSPATSQQVVSALRVLASPRGQIRVQRLRANACFFRSQLRARGFHVFGDDCSPVVPVMLYYPCKMPAFSRASLQRRIAAVVVGYPATPFLSSRIRFVLTVTSVRFLLSRTRSPLPPY